jgi:hypothetical protein
VQKVCCGLPVWFILYEKAYMKFLNRELTSQSGNTPRAEVFRLPNGQIVYFERDINASGWARITRLCKRVGSDDASQPCTRWTYPSAAEAVSALAEWDPETAAAPAGGLAPKPVKNSSV